MYKYNYKKGYRMKVAGIIAEYNPFHEGHRYHIEETKRVTGADYVIVVMSGDYVQRGEPAIVNKYLRTKMALEGGADVVLEMPVIYSTASAEFFATAGVGMLDALGCVDVLSFGSEWADVEELSKVSELLLEEPQLYKETLKQKLESGYNFPQAREAAVVSCTGNETYGKILDTPNHILGIEYIKALLRKESRIQPIAIARKGSGYHVKDWSASEKIYPSATSLRHILGKEKMSDSEKEQNILKGVPFEAETLFAAYENGDMVTWEDLMPFLDYTVLMKQKVLGKYFGMDFDLSKRIEKQYQSGKSFEEIVDICHSKNYTDAALRRVLLHLVLQIKDYPFLHIAADIPIPYIRVLGLRKEAGKLLSLIRENGQVPLIQKLVEGRELGKKDPETNVIFQMNLKCSDLYEQVASSKAGRKAVKEITRGPVIL